MRAEAIGAPSLPRRESPRGFWIAALLCDAVLLAFTGHLFSLVGALLLLAAIVLFLGRAEWLLAFFLLGMPLLYPFQLGVDTSNAILVATRALFVPAWWISLQRARRSAGEPPPAHATGERSAAHAIGEPPAANALALFPGLLETIGRVCAAPATWFTLVLALMLFLRLPESPAPLYGAGKAHSFLIANVALFLAPALLWPLWMRAGLDRLVRALLIIGGLFVIAGLAHAFGWQTLEWERGAIDSAGFDPATGVASRLGWLGVDPIWTARALAAWLVLLAWAASRRLLKRPLAVVVAIPALWLLLGTGSRGPLAALLLSPLALLLLPVDGARRSAVKRVIVYGLVAAFLLALLIAIMPAGERERLAGLLSRTPQGTELSSSPAEGDSGGLLRDPASLYRRLVLARGFTLLEDALPWGAGTGAFPALLFLRDTRLYPHNIEAELLLEQGWVGLALFLLFLFAIWREARRLARRASMYRWPALLFFMAFVNAQVSGDLSVNAEIWFWGGVICAAAIATRAAARPCTARGE